MSFNNAEYARKWSMCRAFATDATCARGASCRFSHSLIDTSRIVSLVGDVPHLPIGATSASSPANAPEQILFLIEYTKYSAQVDPANGVDPDATKWRMRLCGGGRATLNAGAESISVYPTYPLKGQGPEAAAALAKLETRVFGRCAPADFEHASLCRAYSNGVCNRGTACRFSHTLFDVKRIESLLDEAVIERAYKDFRPILEVELIARLDATEKVHLAWRVTLRCVLGYHQKTAPHPVVVMGIDLHVAMRMLERQFAAGSGKPQPPEAHIPRSRARTGPPRGFQADSASQSHQHGRTRSSTTHTNPTGKNTPQPTGTHPASPPPHAVPPSGAEHGRSTASVPSGTGRRTPPPSYYDTMQGNYTHPTHPSSKHAL